MGPILIMKLYMAIPKRIRRVWSFGVSSSHLALADIMASSTPWRTLWAWGWPNWSAFWTQGPDQLWLTRKTGVDSPFWVLNGRRGNQ